MTPLFLSYLTSNPLTNPVIPHLKVYLESAIYSLTALVTIHATDTSCARPALGLDLECVLPAANMVL